MYVDMHNQCGLSRINIIPSTSNKYHGMIEIVHWDWNLVMKLFPCTIPKFACILCHVCLYASCMFLSMCMFTFGYFSSLLAFISISYVCSSYLILGSCVIFSPHLSWMSLFLSYLPLCVCFVICPFVVSYFFLCFTL